MKKGNPNVCLLYLVYQKINLEKMKKYQIKQHKLFIMVNCWLMSFYIYIDAYFRLLKDCYLVKFQRAWPYFWGVWPRFHQHFITCTVIKVNIKFIRITLFEKK